MLYPGIDICFVDQVLTILFYSFWLEGGEFLSYVCKYAVI